VKSPSNKAAIISISNTIEALLMAKIDRLEEQTRDLVKEASEVLFGPCFRFCSNVRLLKGFDFEVMVISFTEDEDVIEKILKHLELWDMKARPPLTAKTPSVAIYLDDPFNPFFVY
jgi:hypothetical protein